MKKKAFCPKKMVKTEKILVVDDEPVVCNMLKKFLTKKGYKVATVLNGEAAVKKVKKEKFFMVFLDIRMPGMDGIEVLKRIREIDREANIVMITAVKDDEIGKRCIKMGAYDYVTKPLGLDYLESVLTTKLLGFKR